MFAIKNKSEKDNVAIIRISRNIEFSAKQTSCARNQIFSGYVVASRLHILRRATHVASPWKIQFSWAEINLYRISWLRVEMCDVACRFDICGKISDVPTLFPRPHSRLLHNYVILMGVEARAA